VFPPDFPGLQKKGEEDQKSFFEFLVLNKTEGCLTQELQTTQVCNLTREAKRPPKEEFGMMGDHTIKSQRPRSVHEKRVPQEQADAAKFMAQTGESGVEEWSQWSTCSVTCGQGSQVRTRTCVSPYGTHCSGPLRESRVCNNTALCPGSVSSTTTVDVIELCHATHLERFVIFI